MEKNKTPLNQQPPNMIWLVFVHSRQNWVNTEQNISGKLAFRFHTGALWFSFLYALLLMQRNNWRILWETAAFTCKQGYLLMNPGIHHPSPQPTKAFLHGFSSPQREYFYFKAGLCTRNILQPFHSPYWASQSRKSRRRWAADSDPLQGRACESTKVLYGLC